MPASMDEEAPAKVSVRWVGVVDVQAQESVAGVGQITGEVRAGGLQSESPSPTRLNFHCRFPA
jgi:hypothetical protein